MEKRKVWSECATDRHDECDGIEWRPGVPDEECGCACHYVTATDEAIEDAARQAKWRAIVSEAVRERDEARAWAEELRAENARVVAERDQAHKAGKAEAVAGIYAFLDDERAKGPSPLEVAGRTFASGRDAAVKIRKRLDALIRELDAASAAALACCAKNEDA